MTVRFQVLATGLGFALLQTHLTAHAGLEGARRQNVLKVTYESCLSSAGSSSPTASFAEKDAWCNCFSTQVVDIVTPKEMGSPPGSPGNRETMTRISNQAIAYCRRKLQ